MQRTHNPEVTHKYCPICSSQVLAKLEGYESAYLYKCRSCNFVFSLRIPAEQELQMCYANYGQKEFHSPVTRKRFEQLLLMFEPYRENNRILDLGCGYGAFLDVAREKGWEVFGTEFSEKAIEIARRKGIEVIKAGFSVEGFEPGSFDVIIATEVIEHLPHPGKAIADVKQGLRKGGVLYLTTPNFDSFLRHRLGPEYNIIDHPEHLSYFNKKSMHHCLSGNGFKKIFLKSHGLSLTRLRASRQENKNHIIAAESTDEKIRTALEINQLNRRIKDLVNGLLSVSGLGDTLKALYQKI